MTANGVRACINAKVGVGRLRPEDAAQNLDMLEQLLAERAGRGPAAEDEATAALSKAARRRAEEFRYQAGLQIVRDKDNLDRLDAYRGTKSNAVLAMLEPDIYDDGRGLPSAASEKFRILGEAHRILFDGIERFRLKGLQLRGDEAGQLDWIRGIYSLIGDADSRVTDNGKALAEIWQKATAALERRYKAAGGILPEKDQRIYLPNPTHSQQAIARVGKQAWVDQVFGLLDRERMRDWQTDEVLNDGQLTLLLEEVYDTLSTGGRSKLDGTRRRRAMLGRRMDAVRVLQFKDADSWIAYNTQFGDQDVFSTLLGHVDRLARDTALLDRFGPDPDAAMRRFADLVRQEGGATAEAGAKLVEATYRILSGQDVAAGTGELAQWGAGLRAWLAGQQLGSAMLTAVSDWGLTGLTSHWNGLRATSVMKHYVGQLNPASAADRKAAAEMGLVVENAIGAAHASLRFADSSGAPRLAGRYADFIMRASMLSPHTQAARSAFGMVVMGELADQSGKAFDKLPGRFKRMLETYGIGPAEWAQIRQAAPYEHRGGKYITAGAVEAVGGTPAVEAAQRLSQLLFGEMDRAVPTSSARVSALLNLGTERGSIKGEALRSFTMYKRFPVLIIHNHLARLFGDNMGSWVSPDGAFRRGAYMAGVVAYTTVMGAVALQLSEVSNGRDPRDMETPEFWGAALVKGGGLGIFGDFLYQTGRNQSGRTILSSLGGPVVGLTEDTLALSGGNIGQWIRGEKTNTGREIVRYLDRYVIPFSTLWQIKLAQERLVIDQLQKLADPQAAARFRTLERNARKNFDQEFYWRPGRSLPDRAPALDGA